MGIDDEGDAARRGIPSLSLPCTGDDQTIARSACYIRMHPLGQAVFCEQPSVQSKYIVSPQRSGL